MKTSEEILRQLEQLKKVTEDPHYGKPYSSYNLMNQGSINALEWVLE